MTEKAVEENTTLVQKVTEGGEYFAVAHIFASFNDTFVVSHLEPLLLLLVNLFSFLLFFSLLMITFGIDLIFLLLSFVLSTSLISLDVKLSQESPVE